MFYRPEIMHHPRWNELSSLHYLTLTEYTLGKGPIDYDQQIVEHMCWTQAEYAGSYDWVLVADPDEYLWLPGYIGVKQFLHRYSNMRYLSFGKQMYTLDHRVDMADDLNHNLNATGSESFAVSKYPFHMKHFCSERGRKGNPICPKWFGRSKVMVRPSGYHENLRVHGMVANPDPEDGTIHFHADVVHLKEWPHLFRAHSITQRPPQNFNIHHQDEVHIHDMHNSFMPIGGDNGEYHVTNGTWLVEYDDQLEIWFDFVISRGTTDDNTQVA